ncbi:hypothetical protein LshimejAT787_2400480 [Lyophyllum shimeji]|uniref:Uncharacterized protein n=1 Tax=Lyophyllum shimeji TaxID=47721 RepID=A0A9P3Q0W1_LYOSH|nr:hypothetical protein LshimejAT787_2400480 [Lyophyllum shimeji]
MNRLSSWSYGTRITHTLLQAYAIQGLDGLITPLSHAAARGIAVGKLLFQFEPPSKKRLLGQLERRVSLYRGSVSRLNESTFSSD